MSTMTDTENSDDERYANESFENESDTDAPEASEYESVSTENSDDDEDDEDLPSVKINTVPIKRNSYPNNFTSINKTDVVPFASSSDEEDDVIVGQTLAEINTQSMLFEDEPSIPTARHLEPFSSENNYRVRSDDEEAQQSSEEISEEDEEEDEEFKRIKDMEEKYLQQLPRTTPNQTKIEHFENIEENKHENIQEDYGNETESENENEEQSEIVIGNEQEIEIENENEFSAEEENYKSIRPNKEDVCDDDDSKASVSSETQQSKFKETALESIDQTKLIQIIQSSLTNVKINPSNDNDDNSLKMRLAPVLNGIDTQNVNMSNIINHEKIILAVVNALTSAGLTNLEAKDKPETKEQNQEFKEDDKDVVNSTNNDLGKDKEVEVEEIQNNDSDKYDDDRDLYYNAHFDYRITSKTPTSFNSDDYVFHANFIKQFHRTNSTDKLRVKPHPRKSMSFSNERMREIERHNQILLRKILTQKPTYTHKIKTPQVPLQKLPSQTYARLTTSAVNRKKQNRQIGLDNQVLKRKIEAIALRKHPLLS